MNKLMDVMSAIIAFLCCWKWGRKPVSVAQHWYAIALRPQWTTLVSLLPALNKQHLRCIFSPAQAVVMFRYKSSKTETLTSRFLQDNQTMFSSKVNNSALCRWFFTVFSIHSFHLPFNSPTHDLRTVTVMADEKCFNISVINILVIIPLHASRCASMGYLSFRGSRRCSSQVKHPL